MFNETEVARLMKSLAQKSAMDSLTGCINWTAHKTKDGYGKVMFKKRSLQAHRASYMCAKGEIPKGGVIDHLCRNRACINPDHLEVVDNRENFLRGESPTAVLYRMGTCRKGHPLAADRERLPYGKLPQCKICNAEAQRRCKARKKEKLLSRAAPTPVTTIENNHD